MTHFQLGNSCVYCFRTPQASSAAAVELRTRHFRGRCSRYQSLCLLHYILDHSSLSIQNCFLPWKQESWWFWTCLSQSSLILPPVTSAFTSSKSAHQTARVRLALMNNSSSSSSFPVCEPDSLNKLTDNAVMFSFRVLSSFCLPLTEFCCKVLICSFFPFFLWLVTQEESSIPDIFHYKIPEINMKCFAHFTPDSRISPLSVLSRSLGLWRIMLYLEWKWGESGSYFYYQDVSNSGFKLKALNFPSFSKWGIIMQQPVCTHAYKAEIKWWT